MDTQRAAHGSVPLRYVVAITNPTISFYSPLINSALFAADWTFYNNYKWEKQPKFKECFARDPLPPPPIPPTIGMYADHSSPVFTTCFISDIEMEIKRRKEVIPHFISC
jgi:hypothetical protein